ILGPQMYVGLTQDNKSMSRELTGLLKFFDTQVMPLKVFPHMSRAMLERFTFEHNENLMRSIDFLDSGDEHLGMLRIYSIVEGLSVLVRREKLFMGSSRDLTP